MPCSGFFAGRTLVAFVSKGRSVMRVRLLVIIIGCAALGLSSVSPVGASAVHKAKSNVSPMSAALPDVGAFGDAAFLGSTGPTSFNQPLVGIAATPSSHGYWEVANNGAVFAFGDARYFGSMGGKHLNQPIVGIAATPTGSGYWLAARDGGIFAFGDAPFYGSTGNIHLNQPIVGITSTPSGHGYWLAAADGGVFTFGNAHFFGSMGGTRINQPVVGIASTHAGDGYWLAAADGGIFTFGHAHYWGSAGPQNTFNTVDQPVVGIAATVVRNRFEGYWIVSADGRRFSFGSAFPLGDKGGTNISRPIVGIAPTWSGNGYWLIGRGTPGTLPGPVTVVRAHHGGGSGELGVSWNGVAGASGYRLSRANTPTGSFSIVADINVTTGKVTKAPDVLDVVSFVERGTLRLEYTELVTSPGTQPHYFHVTPYNAAGDGPPSVLVCGTAIGNPDC